MTEIALGEGFKMIRKLGSGTFGEVFLVQDLQTKKELAVKSENINAKHPQLVYEAKLYQYLLNDYAALSHGIPSVFGCTTNGSLNIMLMEPLGPSLEELLNLCGGKFSLKTVLMAGIQMLQTVEYIHSRYLLHRDIKPANFVIGQGKDQYKVHIIDFGLAKRYIGKDRKHIPYREGKNLTGTARYASINTHLGIEQSRRDDLETLGHVLLYFLKGGLPWQNIKANNKKVKYEKIVKKKVETSIEVLCKDLPSEFITYMSYCRNLKFEEKPDYNYLKNLFRGLLEKLGYEFDYQYDWVPFLEKIASQGNNNAENKEGKELCGGQQNAPIEKIQNNLTL